MQSRLSTIGLVVVIALILLGWFIGGASWGAGGSELSGHANHQTAAGDSATVAASPIGSPIANLPVSPGASAEVLHDRTPLRGGPGAATVIRFELDAGTRVTIEGESIATGNTVWWPVIVDSIGMPGWLGHASIQVVEAAPEATRTANVPSEASPTSTAEIDATAPATQGLPDGWLFEAEWSAGSGGWSWFYGSDWIDGPNRWHISDGLLAFNDQQAHTPLAAAESGTMAVLCGCWFYPSTSIAVAPYQPTSSNYAIEAEIRVIGSAVDSSFSIAANDGAMAVAVNGGGFAVPFFGTDERPGVRFNPGSDWHTYRLEVIGNEMRFLVDGQLLLALSGRSDRGAAAGNVGIASQLHELEIRRFSVLDL